MAAEDVRGLVEDAENLTQLSIQMGYEDPLEAYDMAAQHLEQDALEYTKESDFSFDEDALFRSETYNDTEYKVYPLVHGQEGYLEPDEEIFDYFQQLVSEKRDKDQPVFTEERLKSSFFPEIDVEEMDDVGWSVRHHPVKHVKGERRLGSEIEGAEEWKRQYDLMAEAGIDVWNPVMEALDDLSAYPEYVEYQENASMPKNLEAEYLEEVKPVYKVRHVDRSERMADYAVHKIPEAVEEAHIFLGGEHMVQFLDRIDEYKSGEKTEEVNFETYENWDKNFDRAVNVATLALPVAAGAAAAYQRTRRNNSLF